MSLQVFDIRKSTGMSRGQSNEHLRNFSKQAYEEKLTHNYDPTREHLNFEVLPGLRVAPVDKNNHIDLRIKRNLLERGIKNPNEGLNEKDEKRRITCLDIIFQGSRDRMRQLAFGNQEIDEGDGDEDVTPDNSQIVRMQEIEEWAKDMYNFACKQFGAKNVIAFVCHLDEKNPHAHCTVLPVGMIKGKERISAVAVIGKNKHEARKIFLKWHDELAKVNEKWGLSRGKNIQTTGAKHRTTEEYWKWLSEKCTELESEKKNLYHEVHLLHLEQIKAQKAVKGLTTMVDNLNSQIEVLQDEIQELEGDRYWTETDVADKQKELEDKKTELLRLQDSLSDKESKLQNAVEKLAILNAKCDKAQKEISDSEKVLSDLIPETRRDSIVFAKSIAWDVAVKEMRAIHERMDDAERDLRFAERCGFDMCKEVVMDDDSLIPDMEDYGEEIINLASSLFCGYINDATTFFHGSSACGGGEPASGWGRKKDEDDREFMMRCLQMAHTMIRKPARRGLRR